MDTKRLKHFMTITALVALPVALVSMGSLMPGGESVEAREAELKDVMALADIAADVVTEDDFAPVESFDLAQATEDLKGAPLNAAPADEEKEVRGAPLGAAPEKGEDPDTEGLTPLRTIPQESLDLFNIDSAYLLPLFIFTDHLCP